ncbi:MAG: hypothetical protein IH597_12485 [Bacteroidales bacterium]|nr:hypothetical protein [Bacteroidales bacterium]
MALVSSKGTKIVALIIISAIVYAGWLKGLEIIYTRVLVAGTNVALGMVKKDTRIELEKANSTFQFKVRTRIDGRKASFTQPFGSLLQPFVIILSWQIFLLIAISFKSAVKAFGVNVGIFLLLQIVFLILLTGYHSSETQKFIYILFMDSFYIMALVLVIKDNMLYQVFRRI